MAIKIAGTEVINDNRELVLAKLTEINSSISSTAVDVFIYDTSKDSDGGAWRHRTQHTSWYAEASSATRDEDTRSTRAEFPAVAVIVAEDHTITIYDGDDPSLPMWMVFPQNTGALGGVTSADKDLTSVAMLNGVLVGGYGNGLSYVNFLSEVLERGFNVNTSNVGVLPFNVSERDQQPVGLGGTLNLEIVNANVNDVAMTVLPDAPTDPATGLPVPTIAVATDGGVSVIKDDGTVVDIHDGSSITGWVDFTDNGEIFFNEGGAANAVTSYIGAIPSADVTSSLTSHFQRYRYTQAPYLSPIESIDGAIVADGNLVYRRGAITGDVGLCILAPLPTNPTGGLVAGVTSSYNTGWMPGDIKLAALADTTAETLSGSELVDNSGFDTDTVWTKGTGWTINTTTGEAVHDEATGDGAIYQDVTVEAGKAYLVVYDVASEPVSGVAPKNTSLQVYDGTGFNLVWGVGTAPFSSVYEVFDGSLRYKTVVVPSGTTIRLRSYSDDEFSISNVSVRLADPDRSVNGNGLGVHGSITKAAVATGADVVAYSGFSASNYLEQPYNSDLDFGAYTGTAGTGDFCIMGWVKTTNSFQTLASRFDSNGFSGNGWYIDRNGSDELRFNNYISGSNTAISAGTISSNVWSCLAVLRRNGVLYFYIDGNEVGNQAFTDTVSHTNSVLYVGVRNNAGSIGNVIPNVALLRISATAPTADQIAKIYEDEKVLFQDSAKATLTGSSDAVTALAHDPDTDLLHVGTSGGRSVFQGLRRVDETATAVTTAISAVDGLVVEQ